MKMETTRWDLTDGIIHELKLVVDFDEDEEE